MSSKLTDAQRALKKAEREALENGFARELEIRGLPKPVRQYRFDPERKWRADFCWPEHRVIADVEGVFSAGGGHRGLGMYLRGIERFNRAAELGFLCFRYTRAEIRDGSAFRQLERVLGSRLTSKP
jgi:hypothetical protein